MTAISSTIERLIERYDYFLLDVWGVIHDGYEVYPGVKASLEKITSLKKQVMFVSNAPRPAPIISSKLNSLGLSVTLSQILTSGDVVRNQLLTYEDEVFSKLGKRFYHLGAEKNQDILSNLLVQTVDQLEEADFILMTAYLDEGEDLEQFTSLFQQAQKLQLPLICANPDKDIINGNQIRYCSGYFALQYEKMNGKVFYYGKPYHNIYKEVFTRLGFSFDDSEKLRRVLMIGDTLETDIQGAMNANIDSALVLTGNMGVSLAKNRIEAKEETAFLTNTFRHQNIVPTWVIPSFGVPH